MLTKEHVCIFIACCVPQRLPGGGDEYGHKIDDIKKFPLPKDQYESQFSMPEHPCADLYCYSCGTYAASGRSGVAIKHCPDCPKNPEEFSNGYLMSRLILTYDSTTYHTLFNLFLHWCHTNPEKYRALRNKIKAPRTEGTTPQSVRTTNADKKAMEKLFNA